MTYPFTFFWRKFLYPIIGWNLLICTHLVYSTEPNHFVELLQQGQDVFQQTDFAQASRYWEAALKEPGISKTPQELDALISLAVAYQKVGNYRSAYDALQQALTLSRSGIGNAIQQIMLFSYSGDVLLAMQRLEAAEKQLDEGLTMARNLNQPRLVAHLLNNLGNALSLQEKYLKAVTMFTQATELAEHAHDIPLQIQALINLSRTHLKQDNLPSSFTAWEKASVLINQITAEQSQLLLLLKLSNQALRILRHTQFPVFAATLESSPSLIYHTTHTILQEATYLADNYDNNRLKAYARGYLGELYEHTQHYSEALQLTNEAIFLSQSYPENLYYWEWQKGRVLQKQQDLVGAEAAYKHALYLVNPIKTRMITGQRDFVDMFYEDIQPIYYHLIDILLKQAKMATKPLERVHRLNQAKNVLEQQKAAEMQNYFQDECISVIHVPKLQQVEPHTAIIHPILLEDRIELLLTLHDSLRQFTVPIPRQVVYETVITFQKTLQQRTTFMFIHQALALYNWLIAPLRKVLDIYEIKTLVIVPDGPLRMIPMSALHDGNHFLIEDFAIAIVPGIDMTDTWPLSRTDANILLNGLSESVQNFSPLPNVPRELKQISAIFSQAKVLLNRDFLIKEMDQALEQTPYTFIHIASHGQFHRDHRRTFLLTYDSKLTMERLQQLLKINEVRQWAVELLTLSACQTAVGDERASLGLAGVALKAGARSALASLWFVNDESTSALISKFYQELTKPGVSKAQALQQAQKQLMTINRFNHPAYWAPFLLIGNWF